MTSMKSERTLIGVKKNKKHNEIISSETVEWSWDLKSDEMKNAEN